MDKNQTVNKNRSVGRKITDMKPIKSVNHRIQIPKKRTVSLDIKRSSLSRKSRQSMDVSVSSSVSKFHNAKQIHKTPAIKEPDHIKPVKHPLIAKTEEIQAKKNLKPTIVEKSAKQIKNEAIEKALNTPKSEEKKASFFKKHSKKFNIFSASVVFIMFAGCLLYIYMPALSVNIASAQAGINASYPEYQPDGYSLDGPVSYSNNEVVISFKANTGNTKFSIKQSKSTWDSSAVRNKVNKDSKGEFTTTEEKGLTIYTYNSNAAWVNGGVLYNITGNAPLSGEQVRKIATSL